MPSPKLLTAWLMRLCAWYSNLSRVKVVGCYTQGYLLYIYISRYHRLTWLCMYVLLYSSSSFVWWCNQGLWSHCVRPSALTALPWSTCPTDISSPGAECISHSDPLEQVPCKEVPACRQTVVPFQRLGNSRHKTIKAHRTSDIWGKHGRKLYTRYISFKVSTL